MTKNKMLSVILAGVMLCGSIPLGFSEPVLQQWKNTNDINEVSCDNENHVLVMRDNGTPACVSEKSAMKLGWEIVENQKTLTSTDDFENSIITMTHSESSSQGMEVRGFSPYSTVSFPENINLGEPFDVEIEWQYFDGPDGAIDEHIAFDRVYNAPVPYGYNSTNVDVFIDTNGEFINADPKDTRIESLKELLPHLQFGYQYYEREFDYHPTETFSEIVTIQFNEWGIDDQLDGLDWFEVYIGYNIYRIYIYSSGDSATLSKEYIAPQNSVSVDGVKVHYGGLKPNNPTNTTPASSDPNDVPESSWDDKFVVFLEFYQDENETLAESMLDMGFNEQYIEKFMAWYDKEYGASTQNFLPSFSFFYLVHMQHPMN